MCEFSIFPKPEQLPFDSDWTVWLQSFKKAPSTIEIRLRLCPSTEQISSHTRVTGDIFVDLMKPYIETLQKKTRLVRLEFDQSGLQLTCRAQPVVIQQTVISALQLIFHPWQTKFSHWKEAKERVAAAYSMILQRKSLVALDVVTSLMEKNHFRIDQKLKLVQEFTDKKMLEEFVELFKCCSFKQCFILGGH